MPPPRASAPAIMCASVSFCHGCCCGTISKHPDVDQDGLRRQLREGLREHAVVKQTACLDLCEDSNIMVVSPSPLARRGGARPVYLRRMLSGALIDAVVSWVQQGGPGIAPMPPALNHHLRKRPAVRSGPR